ncbi:UDP-2,3-diacylglucosamine diphosphatase [Leptothrix discophora]|uniref:UDP-2,3-diacylglucosamine diphosphatase n=1 Tax=Leptothrix discophora TaxID=89 RepID=A0ABT9G6H7_LEPDI|nr:UDP-2,3-diacylglucosamine diphosphatase [Leptothrix discophora]MDP4302078.1 UDP-2,3-diacylglucosamine diphosphatase [Leptothrix discophora]
MNPTHTSLMRTSLPEGIHGSGLSAGLPPAWVGNFLPPDDPAGSDGSDSLPDRATRLKVRSVFISDVHLGTPGCQADALLDFLRCVECEQLYLVGDIIDGWQLRRRWFWPQAHNDVVQKLLRKVRKGSRVIFVPGNHDEFARRYIGHHFGGVEVVEDCIHRTADGSRYWVTHGDLFDGVVQCARWLALVGDRLYEFALRLNRHLNSLRARLGLPYWSLSRYLKLKVKRAVSFIGDFESAVAREARKRGVDGVVCGHIHHAELREIDGVIYANDGDWVESLTALVEHADGRLEIVDWSEELRQRASRPAAAAVAAA